MEKKKGAKKDKQINEWGGSGLLESMYCRRKRKKGKAKKQEHDMYMRKNSKNNVAGTNVETM